MSLPTPSTSVGEKPLVVLFDGVCDLCNAWVTWVIDRDPLCRMRFLPLQSAAGEALLKAAGVGEVPLSTIVVVEQGRAFVRSTAVLRVARTLQGPWRWAWPPFVWVPAPLRDIVYRAVAASRYRLFGKRETCRVPTPELRAHFLDANDVAAALAMVKPLRAGERTAA
ncbi:MAG: DUF393 domain-containing protein [Flavobacteriales bacterium]|nr:DUF393 domain-containing protein [Flavobacteriales bacterium]